MKTGSYLERCLEKASLLLKEVFDEHREPHVYKLIFAYWEISEMLIRSIVYKLKKTVYERPGKLISVFLNVYTRRFGENFDLFLNIRQLYALRRRCVHAAWILSQEDLAKGRNQFCAILNHLKPVLRELGLNVRGLSGALESCDQR